MNEQNQLLAIALQELGQAEVKGDGSNPRISEYLKSVGLGSSDEIPWCSAFLCWCADKARLTRPQQNAALARSWLKVGSQAYNPVAGDIAIFSRGAPDNFTGHVGIFLAATSDGRVYVLGGNQKDKVSVAAFKAAELLDYRRLSEA